MLKLIFSILEIGLVFKITWVIISERFTMARLAIFVDGGYADALSRREAKVSVDAQKLVTEITTRVRAESSEPIDIFRSFYYTCRPTRTTRRPKKIEHARVTSAASGMLLNAFHGLRCV